MPGSRKMLPVVCGMCEQRCKKLPASWTTHGCEFFCSSCWGTVKCTQCGHSDPKGTIFQGRYRCRACSHRRRFGAAHDVLDAHHRVLIEDGNGEAPPALPDGAAPELAGWGAAAAGAEGEEEEEALEAVEGGDVLAPLPGARAARGDAASARSAAREGHVVLLLDVSGSMRTLDVRGEAPGGERGQERLVARFEAAAKCAADFVRAHARLHPRDVFSVVTFNEATEVICAGLPASGACDAMEFAAIRCLKGTSYLAALKAGAKLSSARPGAHVHMILLSDGRPADPKAALEFFQSTVIRSQSTSQPLADFHFHGIGFGDSVRSFAALQQLACLGGGAFALAGSSIQSLCHAFATVSSTITSISSHSSVGDHQQGEQPVRIPRQADFEVPDLGVFGKSGVLRFRASRTSMQFNGVEFNEQSWQAGDVARRVMPHMRGGMRLVYAFCDKRVVSEDNSWMVAKCSRWLNEALNTRAAVEAHAKSTAVARYFAARFNEQLRGKANGATSLFFVPCDVYMVEEGAPLPDGEPRVFAGERYLPGVFLKYTSNNGYVGSDGPGLRHREVVEAFAHFSFVASGGRTMVSDLQGVARAAEVLLTDPQVLSLEGPRFGPGDLGARGLRACLAAHRCGPTCRLLGLPPVSAARLRSLGAPAPQRRSGGASSAAGSGLSSGWERCSEAGAGSEGWERVGGQGLLEFALSDGQRSSQTSASSWVHVLDG